ncbi:MAG TPA: SRPBCC domain-containing protein [Rhodoglobus sp.]|jgi:uncharacterized protein YndB with AHSA1/START domain|nr:SRPBCC domain-containing protein [Rhodoglobus sp.]HOY81424.1 SRPBCC domain-containing protein [Rhodoglobus sp.]HPG75300.1 SRPBCC domain-containing protein [Rhodoglobus sp.]HPM52820.1 SRPBCC domain-containing protein [Rhodoglobus sp.]HQG69897.1 SRPBCC domain-containing protein [Rhodoglobus sp.]
MTESFTITRTLAAPPELVWDVWTKPEHFAVWFGTEAVEVPLDSVTLDVRVGGKLAAIMNIPGGPTINWEGEYTEVDRPRRLAFTLSDNPDEYAGVPIVATFTPVDGGTEVSLTQDRGDFSDEQVQATIDGYNSFYDSMERVLATIAG